MEINFIHAAIISNYFIMQLFLLTKKKQICSQAFCANTFKAGSPRLVRSKSYSSQKPEIVRQYIFVQVHLLYVWVYEFMALILVCRRIAELLDFFKF